MVFLQARTARDVIMPDSLGDMGVADEARAVLESMGRDLDELGLSWQHVTMVGVYLGDMSDFAAVNSVYTTFLPIR
jgi:enamine deaminase RidA (YjgF/YER057c/UK114 family)